MRSDLRIACPTQGTAEWFAARMGCLGSSRIYDAVTKRKNGDKPLQARIDLCFELAVERITRKPMEHYVSKYMEIGREREPLARAAYWMRTGSEAEQIGFVLHPSIKWAGCSPDGLVGDDGLVEFKCPKSTTHAEYIIGEAVPDDYKPQMFWQMAVTKSAWNDFVSYCPDFPEPLDLFVCRLYREEAIISAMEGEAVKFLAEVEALTARLRRDVKPSIVPAAVIPEWDESLHDA
jgi:putative phage-type endonuclease